MDSLVNWSLSLLNRVAGLNNIIAIKEDAKDDAYSKEVIKTLRERISIIISGGGSNSGCAFAIKDVKHC